MPVSRIETLILQTLTFDESVSRKILPFLEDKFFEDATEKIIFSIISEFIIEFNACPTRDAILIKLDGRNISESNYKECKLYVQENLSSYNKPNEEFFLKESESFCQERALISALREGIAIIDGRDKRRDVGSIPDIMKGALSTSFNPSVGLSYTEDIEERYDFYRKKEEKIGFHLDKFNQVTQGGIPKKTLNIIIAGTNVGKSLAMCDFAANYYKYNYNVFYGSFEMSKERIMERIDANLLNIPIGDLRDLPKDHFIKKIKDTMIKTSARIYVEDYPTSSASILHVKQTLNELRLKKNFKPDVIVLDYLNLILSSRIKHGNSDYSYIKHVAEEIRGMAVEYDVVLWTATQFNRSGFSSSDADMTDTAESFGIPMTADYMVAMINNDTLEQQNQIEMKELKTRYNYKKSRFFVGIDRTRMKLFDVDQPSSNNSASNNPAPSAPRKSLASFNNSQSMNPFSKFKYS